MRLYLFGVAIGAGLGVGMGPQLPLLTDATAVADEPAPESTLPQQILVFRNALLDPSVSGASVEEQREAIETLHQRWVTLLDTLDDMRQEQFAVR